MTIRTTIVWGTDREEKKSYEFATAAEHAAFIHGVDEANGWMEYEEIEVLDNYDEEQLPTDHGAGAQPSLEFLEQNEIKIKTKGHKRQATGASNKQATSGKK